MIDTSADCAKCDPLDGIAQTLDHASAAVIAQMTSGLSPVTMLQAWLDWCAHLAISPGRRLQLVGKAGRKVQRIADYATRRVGGGDAAPAEVACITSTTARVGWARRRTGEATR